MFLLAIILKTLHAEISPPYEHQNSHSDGLDQIYFCQQKFPTVQESALAFIDYQLTNLNKNYGYADTFLKGSPVNQIRAACPYLYYIGGSEGLDNNELLSRAKERGLTYMFVNAKDEAVALLNLGKDQDMLHFDRLSSGGNSNLDLALMKKLNNYPELQGHYEFRALLVGSLQFEGAWLKGSDGLEDKIIPLFDYFGGLKANEMYTEQNLIDGLKQARSHFEEWASSAGEDALDL